MASSRRSEQAGAQGAEAAPRLRVTLAHDFTETYGGAERVLAAFARMFPDAPVWSILGRRRIAERIGIEDRIETLLPERDLLLRGYRGLAPVYPLLVRRRRLPAADLLLSSSYAFANGFRTVNDAPKLCYCHSPLRFAWSMTSEYADALERLPLGRRAVRPLASAMRGIDRRAAASVTRFVANSSFVAQQIEAFYGRSSAVVRPPVDTALFRPADSGGHDGYYLLCGRLVEAYKRPSLAVAAFTGLDRRLLVAGDGPALGQLRHLAGPNVEFLGALSDDELIPLMQRCAALVFPSRDDFGLLPVEVMVCGRPVLAFAGGGALETVVAGETGEFFPRQEVGALREAIREFDPDAYDPAAIRRHAERFGRDRFEQRIREEAVLAARGERL